MFKFESKNIFVLCLALVGCYTIYSLFCQYTFFRSGIYTYFDLGLISDFLANTANQNKIFWVENSETNHLSLHFTPILFLIVPLFKIFESQLIFPIVSVLAVGLSLVVLILILKRIVAIYKLTDQTKSLIYLSCVFVFITNPYLKSLMLSAHYEVFYLLFSLVFILGLIKNYSLGKLFLLTLLILFCRQDAGIFFLVPFSIFFFPIAKPIREQISDFKRKYVILVSVMVFYSFFVIKIVMPQFVQNHNEMSSLVKTYWGHWGSSYSEIILNVTTSPLTVLKSAYHGAFWRFNRSFYFFPLIDIPSFIFVNLPGFIFYISSDFYKNQLIFYNSAFLLPAFFITSALGIIRIYSSKFLAGKNLIQISTLAFIVLSLFNFTNTTYGQPSNLWPRFTFDKYKNFNETLTYINQKYHPESFATSDDCFIYLPNSKIRYLYKNALKADVVIVSKHDMQTNPSLAIELQRHQYLLDEAKLVNNGFAVWTKGKLL